MPPCKRQGHKKLLTVFMHVQIWKELCQLFKFWFILTAAGQEVVSKPQGKAELRRQYLLEKYVWKWKQFMRSRKGEGLFPRLLKLSHNNWLRQVCNLRYVAAWFSLDFSRHWLLHEPIWMKPVTVKVFLLQVLFTPATQAARQAACTIVEALTTIPSRKQQVLDLLTR